MDRLIAPNTVSAAQADAPPASGTGAYATDGNPATNVPATQWPAYQYNAFQEELIAILAAAGITPSRTNNAQVVAAIQKLAQGVRMQYASFTTLAVTTPLTNAVAGGLVRCLGAAAPVTFTMPSCATMSAQSTVTFYNDSAFALTIAPFAGQSIVLPNGTPGNVVMAPGTNLVVTSLSTTECDVTSGSAAIQFLPLVIAPAVAAGQAVQLGQVQSMLLGASAITPIPTATTLTAANTGQLCVITAGVAATLPAASTVPAGQTIEFFSSIAGGSVGRASTNTITVNGTTVTSIPLNAGDTLTLMSNGVNGWYAVGGTAQLQYAASFVKFAGLGAGLQAATNVAGSRSIGATFMNSTPLPIFVMANISGSTAGIASFQINSTQVAAYSIPSAGNATFTMIVPAGSSYGVASSTGTFAINTWWEIR